MLVGRDAAPAARGCSLSRAEADGRGSPRNSGDRVGANRTPEFRSKPGSPAVTWDSSDVTSSLEDPPAAPTVWARCSGALVPSAAAGRIR